MNSAHLLQHFDRVSEAPDAIPCLRQFILELAVRGKLVDHDPKDEPASELLKRILAEKARRIRDEQMKKQEPLPQVRPDEAWFDFPASWIWVRLGTITQVLMGQSPPGETYNKTGEGIPLINGPVEFTEGPFGKTVVNQYTTAPTNLCEEGDLLLCVRGSTTGRTNIAGFRGCIGRGVAAIRPFFADQYVRLFIWRLRASIIAMGRGIAFPSVSRQQIEELPVPLPPLAEQHRIVAKVDELMALCDRLAAAQAERENRRDRLASASLHRLNNGADAESFREHARFHLRHLALLTTCPEHIQRLRETILQLAVTGKLSEQRPDDGDAQNLLGRLATKRRKARKGSVGDDVESPEPLPPLPETWTWAIINQVAAEDDNAITDGPFGANLKTADYVDTPGYRVIRLQNIGRGHFRMEHRSYIDKERFERLAKHRIFAGDLVVAGLVDPLIRCCEVPHNIGPAIVKADCYRFEVHPNFSSRFALYYLNSPLCQRLAAVHNHGMTLVRIGLGNFRLIPIPVPPLAEQQRIVAKVEELLTLCDRLDAQLVVSQIKSRRRLEALLYEALASSSVSRTQRSHEAQGQFKMNRQTTV